MTGFHKWLQDGHDTYTGLALDDGTNARPLIEIIEGPAKNAGVNELLIVTDGGFDMPTKDFVEYVGAHLGLAVRLYPEA